MLSRIGLVILTLACLMSSAFAGEKPLKVYILAGQSNMQGHGHIRTLDWLGKDEKYGHLLEKVKGKDGQWLTRKDVWIAYPERKKYGNLTVGFGVNDDSIGPALMFGTIMGEKLDEQILLIKTAWGGRSLAMDFRPPSSGKPDFELPKKLKERIEKGEFKIGHNYELMLKQVKDLLGNLKEHFPDYKGQGYEIAGFVWFQGWNDMINQQYTAEYTDNMANFIRDLRKDLKAPKMPVVIGVLGVGGEERANDNVRKFRKAQAAVASMKEFQGNVAAVETAKYWDDKAHKFLEENWVRRKWKSPEAKAEFEVMGNQPPYHYLGSAKIYSLIGYGLAEAMLELNR